MTINTAALRPGLAATGFLLVVIFTTSMSMSMASSASAADVSFGPEQAVIAGVAGGTDVTAGDLDGDDAPDLIVLYESRGEVRRAINSGDGSSWTASTVLADGTRPRRSALGDLDGDGDLDVVYSEFNDDRVFWQENDLDTSGSFLARRQVATVFGPDGVFTIDVDGDEDVDVVVAGRVEDGYFWVENLDGTGTTWARRTIATGFNAAQAVWAGDLDGDGDVDVVGGSASNSGRLAWFEQIATGFTTHIIDTAWIQGVTVADIDGDGDPDVVAQERGSSFSPNNQIVWWRNDAGDGSTWTEVVIDSLAEGGAQKGLQGVDLDRDGDLDVVGAADGDWFDNSSGDGSTWVERSYSSAGNIADTDVADVDGDGDSDIFATRGTQDRAAWWENLQCSPSDADSDGDGVRDGCDVCPGSDDAVDGDADGTPDACEPGLRIDDVTQAEGDGGTTLFTFTVSLEGPSPGGIATYTTRDGTATAPSDYTATSGTLTFAGTDGETQTVVVVVDADSALEPDESFEVVLSSSSILIVDGTGVGTILNDDSVPAQLAIGDVSMAEGDGGTTDFVFTVTLTEEAADSFTVDYSTSDGSAQAPGDYTSSSGTLSFAGNDGETQTVTVPVVGDALVEISETFTVNLGTPSDTSVLITDSSGIGVIGGDDMASISIGDVARNEGDFGPRTVTFTVTLDGDVDSSFTVPFTTRDGSATVADADYVSRSGILTFAGSSGETQTIAVTLNGDLVVEPDESFTVDFGTPSNSRVTASDRGTAVVRNDDSAAVAIDDVSMAEGTGGPTDFIFTVTLTGEVAGGFTVPFSTSDGTATASDEDYAPSAGIVTFAGSDGETETITITVEGDAKVEADETFTVNLGAPSNPGVTASDGTGQATVVNDDSATLAIDDVTQAEGDAGTTDFIFTVTLTGEVDSGVEEGVTVSYSTADGSATASDGDYVETTGTLAFAGSDGETETIIVTVGGDTVVEPDQGFTVELGTPPDPDVTLADGSGAGTIENDDATSLAIGDVSQAEGDGGSTGSTGFTFDVTLTDGVEGGVSVDYSTADGSATAADGDYASSSGTVTFAGTAGESQTVTIDVLGDLAVEADETFTVELGAPSNPDVTVSDGTGLGTIVNDDSASITIDDVSQAEGDAGPTLFDFTVTSVAAVDGGFTVDYATADGTATVADGDYVATAGTLIFAGTEGETQTVTVEASGDLVVEGDETFTVELTDPPDRDVTLGDGSGLGTIVGDDTGPILELTKEVQRYDLDNGRVEYLIQIINSGMTAQVDDPTSDEFEDLLPADLELLSATSDSPTFTVIAEGDTNLVLGNGSITAGEVVSILIEALVLADVGEEVSNQAIARYDANSDGTNDTTITSDDPTTAAPNDSTVFRVSIPVVDIPTVGGWGLLILALLLAATALRRVSHS